MGTPSPKSLSLLSMGHWSSPPARGRSFSYKPWFMMLWWWVSFVLCWFVCSHVGFPFMFSISLLFTAPFCGLVCLVMGSWDQKLSCQQGCGSSGARHQQSAWRLCCGCAAISLSELGAAVLSTVIKIYSVLSWQRNCIFGCKRSQRSRVDLNSLLQIGQSNFRCTCVLGGNPISDIASLE